MKTDCNQRNLSKRSLPWLAVLVCSLLLSVTVRARETRQDISQDERMGWWREARFGMFIHWGLYSILGGEWNGKDYGKEMGGTSAEWILNSSDITMAEYRKLAGKFNPVEFDAKQWVGIAKSAGMKYMVITSKHHDGFCLFDTANTDYNVMDATPFKRDIIKELSEECARQGIRFGVYYSQNKDWYHRGLGRKWPGAMTEEEYLAMVRGHIDELLKNYGDMAILWFDTGAPDVEEANEQGARVRVLQPSTIICSRLYSRNIPRKQKKYADFESLPDRTLPRKRMQTDAETCMTMRLNWGYDRDDDNWKSPARIVRQLVLTASRGVNFLLNIGPTPRGSFTPQDIERLKAVGEWMQINGESIYGSSASPLDYDFKWGAITQKGNRLYLHVFKWDPKGIELKGIVGRPSRAFLLADPERDLKFAYNPEGHVTAIEVPAASPDSKDSVIVLEYSSGIEVDRDASGKQ